MLIKALIKRNEIYRQLNTIAALNTTRMYLSTVFSVHFLEILFDEVNQHFIVTKLSSFKAQQKRAHLSEPFILTTMQTPDVSNSK